MMYTMAKNNELIRWRWITLMTTILMVVLVHAADAAGTPAGTIIKSRSQVVYTSASGTHIDTVYSPYVSIVVSQVGSFNINPVSNSLQSAGDSVFVNYPIVVTNSGNGTDKGLLSSVSGRGWVTALYFDANGDGILQAAEKNSGSVSQTSNLPADEKYNLILSVFVPRSSALNGIKDTTLVTIRSGYDNSKIAAGSYVTTVSTVNLSVGSALTVDNSNPTVGSPVVFSLTLTNTGTVNATSVNVSDLIPTGFTFIAGNTTQGTFNGSGTPLVWNVGTIAVGSTVTITMSLRVNENVPTGAILSNSMAVQYNIGTLAFNEITNTRSITVGGSPYGVRILPLLSTLSQEPSDTAVVQCSVKNTGLLKDVITLGATSTQPLFAWSIFKDVNNNGILDASDVSITRTDSLSGGDSILVFARSIVPRYSKDLVKDSLKITAVSSGNTSVTSTAATVITVHVPVLSLINSVSPVGSQPAGTEMTYTITYSNTGSAPVSNFQVTDVTPPRTTYILNSITLNGTSIQDNASSVQITDNGSGNKIIGVRVGTLPAKSNGKVQFRVKIVQ